MAKDRKGSPAQTNGKEEEQEEGELSHVGPSKRDHGRKSKRKKESETEEDDHYSEGEGKKRRRKKKKVSKRRSRRRYSDEDSYSSSSYSSDSKSDGSDYSSEESESEDERHRRKRKERKRRKEREYEKEKRRIRREKEKEKEKKRRKRDKEGKDKKKNKKTKTKTKKETTKGAVTDSWGAYGIIRETDMWNKRPEFTAWLAEVKQVNLEALSNWEEKQMFKEFMEDHNTATFPSKKYYSLDAYHKRKMEKEMKRGFKRGPETERTIFNDEEQRRQELQLAREKMKEEQVEALKHSMQSGLAQAMKEQAQLREEMAYQYKLGNFEAAAAIQRRLDPDVAI